MKPTYRRSWAGNLLIFSDLTLGPSFKVKRWFTGFGELSLRWIQICIGTPMLRSRFHLISNIETRLGQLGANISPDRSSLTPQVLIGNFLKNNYPLLYELQHINLLCLYLPKEDGVSPDAEYITQIIFSIFLQ